MSRARTDMESVIKEIQELRSMRNAVIISHNYQRPEIQDISDFVGDSLGLSQRAVESDADVIVFCGVDFMAETASIMNPNKKILLPDLNSRCPMAMMLDVDILSKAKQEHPNADVVLYINTHADVKALADCICTSANAVKVVNSMYSDVVLFGPDQNLASYVRKRTDKQIITVPEYGLCSTHHLISEWDIAEAKDAHPDALVIAHPEATPGVQELADRIASTSGMLRYCKSSNAKEFIIATENGILHPLRRENPGKKFYPASENTICPTMKMNTLEKVRDALRDMKPEVTVPEETAGKAQKAIERMLSLSM